MKFPIDLYSVHILWCVGRNKVMWKIILRLRHSKHLSPCTSLVLNKRSMLSHCTLFLCGATVKMSPPYMPAFIKFAKIVEILISLPNLAEIGERCKNYYQRIRKMNRQMHSLNRPP